MGLSLDWSCKRSKKIKCTHKASPYTSVELPSALPGLYLSHLEPLKKPFGLFFFHGQRAADLQEKARKNKETDKEKETFR